MELRPGIFYGVGVGPGDPELMTLKAVRVLERCPVIAAPWRKGGEMLALDIARGAADLTGKEILPLPFTMEREGRSDAHREAVEQIEARLCKGQDVAMVNLGDVSIYSTFCYLMRPLRQRGYEAVMIPGVASFSAVAARLGVSLTSMDAPLHIIPAAAMPADKVFSLPGIKVLMKSGSRLGQVKRALEKRGLLEKAALVSNCGLEGELVCTDLTRLEETPGYFTTIIVKE